jgi:hypothetical protein
MTSEVVDSSSMRALIRRWVKRCFKFTPVRKRAGSSLLSVGSTRFQDGEAAWMFLPPPRLIPEIDGHCSGGREKRQGCVKELRNRIKPKFSGGYVSKVRRLLIAGEVVVPTSQTSGRRGQRIQKVNSLETARNPRRPDPNYQPNALPPSPPAPKSHCSGWAVIIVSPKPATPKNQLS